MRKGGGNKKSENELDRAGTRRKDRHGDPEDVVEFGDGTPHMPEGMSDVSQKAWRRVVSEMRNAGQLKPAFEASLAGYAIVYGKIIEKPAEAKASDHAQLRGYISELGLGPVSSTRLSAGTPTHGDSSDFDGF